MTAGRLLRHDLLLVRNGLADVRRSWRDRALIGVGLLIAAGWAAQTRHPALPAISDRGLAAATAATVCAAAANAAAATRRLRNFVERSPLCADALAPRERLGYRLAYQVPLAAAVLLG